MIGSILYLLTYLFFKATWSVGIRRVDRTDRLLICEAADFAMAAAPTKEAREDALLLGLCKPINISAYLALKGIAECSDKDKFKYILTYFVASVSDAHNLDEDSFMDAMLAVEVDLYKIGSFRSGDEYFRQKPFAC